MPELQNKNTGDIMKKEEFAELVKIARKAIETRKITEYKKFTEHAGVFVTLNTYPDDELRGCIGIIEPIYPLWEGVQRAAISAAYSDPRFMPMTIGDLDKVTVEISVLSVPEKIEAKTAEEKLKAVKKGDGIVLKYKARSSLFLPQVWEEVPDKKEFLQQLSIKAGLMPYSWEDETAELSVFHVTAYKEEKPNGKIKEVKT
jgi:AmmeMemoRadiSam system protein A